MLLCVLCLICAECTEWKHGWWAVVYIHVQLLVDSALNDPPIWASRVLKPTDHVQGFDSWQYQVAQVVHM